jgi:hypothetical protein
MEARSGFDKVEQRVIHDEKMLFTLISYSIILLIFLNLSEFQSPIIGLLASGIYFSINGIFLGHAFFEKETAFLRFTLGLLLLIMLLGFVGWLAVVIYNLDLTRLILVLIIATTFSSLANKKVKNENAT